jgi:hypothetical protein
MEPRFNCWPLRALVTIRTELSLLLEVTYWLCSLSFLPIKRKYELKIFPLCHCYTFRLVTVGRGGGAEVGKLAQGIHWLAEGFVLPTWDKERQVLSRLILYFISVLAKLPAQSKFYLFLMSSHKYKSRRFGKIQRNQIKMHRNVLFIGEQRLVSLLLRRTAM